MSRMIEDTAVLSRIDDIRPVNPKKDNYTHGIDVGLAMAKVAIKDAPTIEERKTGKWIHDGEAFEGGIDWMHCSECGHKDVWCNAGRTPYCPHCGARMKVKAREMPKDVDPGKFGEKICNDFRNGIPLVVEGVKGENNE